MKVAVVMKVAVLILSCSVLIGCGGPLGPLAGGQLSGVQIDEHVTNWSFAADAEQVQLETRSADGSPHSVNVWSAVLDERLYIPTSLVRGPESPQQRGWVSHVMSQPEARLRIGEQIYPVTLSRITGPQQKVAVVKQLFAKYGGDVSARSDQAWVFEVTYRLDG